MRLALILFAAALSSPADLVWKDAPPSLPPGTKVAVLEGDARKEGIFTMRLRVPANASIPLHTHPRAERVTVLSGRVEVRVDHQVKTFATGGFYVNDANVPHSVHFAEESVLQLTCEGPWELHLVTRTPGHQDTRTP